MLRTDKVLLFHNSTTQPYGPAFTIEKEECVNHVSKRLGTALRNVVEMCKKRGITLGGRGKGQLTQAAIRRLTIYYNRAVRGNRTVEEMKKAVYAGLIYGFSTDDKPQHQYCPTGTESWCFFNAAIANHTVPGSHSKRVHT
jgi:hypothetical protein